MKNLIACFQVQQSNTTGLQPQKWEFASFNFIVLNLMYRALSATTKPGVVCPRHPQEGDRRENACPPVAYISDLIRVSPHAFQLADK